MGTYVDTVCQLYKAIFVKILYATDCSCFSLGNRCSAVASVTTQTSLNPITMSRMGPFTLLPVVQVWSPSPVTTTIQISVMWWWETYRTFTLLSNNYTANASKSLDMFKVATVDVVASRFLANNHYILSFSWFVKCHICYLVTLFLWNLVKSIITIYY